MTINEIRRDNARLLAKEIGGDKQFADRMEMDASQVSQIIGKSPVKNIGNIIARRIEVKFEKPRGWLDMMHQENSEPSGYEGASNADAFKAEDPNLVDATDLVLLIELYRKSTKRGREFILDSAHAAPKATIPDGGQTNNSIPTDNKSQ